MYWVTKLGDISSNFFTQQKKLYFEAQALAKAKLASAKNVQAPICTNFHKKKLWGDVKKVLCKNILAKSPKVWQNQKISLYLLQLIQNKKYNYQALLKPILSLTPAAIKRVLYKEFSYFQFFFAIQWLRLLTHYFFPSLLLTIIGTYQPTTPLF